MAPEKKTKLPVEKEVASEDFKFVQLDKSIFDVKFQSKPTTFFKDALLRFVSNKSSVVAGILIGIIALMAVFVPIFNQSDLDTPLLKAQFLPPRWRIFENAGFLDGTMDYEGVIIDYITDPENPTPANFDARGVVGEITMYEGITSTANQFATGGTLVLRTDKRDVNAGLYSPSVYVNTSNTYDFVIDFDELNTQAEVTPIYALYIDVKYEDDFIPILMKDFSSDFGTISITDVSNQIIANQPASVPSYMTVFQMRFRIVLQTNAEGTYPALFINSFTASNANNASDDTFEDLNWDSGNEVLLRDNIEDLAQYAWKLSGSGSKTLRNGKVVLGDFTYNPYLVVFGENRKVIADTKVQEYIDNGWMTYDFDVGISSFEILDDACPIREVISQRVITGPGGVSAKELITIVSEYRYLGFEEMPYYLFGTNHLGYDFFKKVFAGLRTSLILGFMVAAINVMFGMVWGSISGYFGGTVDLLMERFTEILGGVPWIVVMTLAILHLGNTLWVFLLALCLTGWIGTAYTTRSQFYRYKRREYVLASRTLGASDARLIFRHILPNSIGPIVTSAVLIIPGVIFSEATISYLGLGLQGLPSFGVAMSEVQEYLGRYPFLIISAAIVISILMISFNLFGNGLRDAFNPSLKGVQE